MSLEDLRVRTQEQRGSKIQISMGAPLITVGTYGRLCELYGVSYDRTTAEIIQGIKPNQTEQPYKRALRVSEDYLILLKRSRRDRMASNVVDQMGEWMDQRYSGLTPNPPVKDAATVGMTIVVAAFNLNFPFLGHRQEFIDNLANVSPAELMRILGSDKKHFLQTFAVIDRVKDGEEGIPDFQEELNRFLRRFIVEQAPIEEPVRDGASKTYQLIDRLWPDLRPKSISYYKSL